MFNVERVRASWQREAAAIDAVVLTMNGATASEPIRNDGYTAHDLLGHIANASRGFVAYVRGDRSESFDLHELNAQQRERGRQRVWEEVQAYWQRARDEVAAFLAATTDQQGDDPVHLPWLPDVKTKGEALRIMILHTRGHREELERGFAPAQA